MLYCNDLKYLSPWLGLVEFEKCAILEFPEVAVGHMLGLVEFEKCAIF